MSKKISIPSGFRDFMSEDHRLLTFIKKVARHRFRQSGFLRFSPPVMEKMELYERVFKNDDLKLREIYTITNAQGQDFGLIPEVTPSLCRMFVEKGLDKSALPVGYYYINECYRNIRPTVQKRRQFWQFGVEILGENDVSVDAQMIHLANQILSDIRLEEHIDLHINYLGTVEDQEFYYKAIVDFYNNKVRSLSPENAENFAKKKYLELLHPKNEDEEILLKMAPKLKDFFSEETNKYINTLESYLQTFGIKYQITPQLTPTRTYYNQIIFSFQERSTGKPLVQGGRYNGMIKNLGGNDLGSTGFAANISAIMYMMREHQIKIKDKDQLQIFLAVTGPKAKIKALPILIKLRDYGFHTIGVLGKTSIIEQLKRAQKFNPIYTLLLGDEELKKNQIIIRDTKSGKQEWISQSKVCQRMEELLGEDSLDSSSDFLGK